MDQDRMSTGVWKRLVPTGLWLLRDAVFARQDCVDRVAAIRTRHREQFTCIAAAVVVRIDVNRPAANAQFTAVLGSITIRVFKRGSANLSRNHVDDINDKRL